MESIKTIITDIDSYFLIWLVRIIITFSTITSFLETLKVIDFNSPSLSSEFIVYFFVLILLIIYSVKIFIDYSGVTKLYFSSFGISSKNETVNWELITRLYWKEKSGIPILFIEYIQDSEEYVLKTPLKFHQGQKKYKKIRNILEFYKKRGE